MQLQIQKQILTKTMAREQTIQRVVKKGKLDGFMWFGIFLHYFYFFIF
jgi:hypothetical protein